MRFKGKSGCAASEGTSEFSAHQAQGLNPEWTIADAAKGLRAGQKAAYPNIPCHGDVFHIKRQ